MNTIVAQGKEKEKNNQIYHFMNGSWNKEIN